MWVQLQNNELANLRDMLTVKILVGKKMGDSWSLPDNAPPPEQRCYVVAAFGWDRCQVNIGVCDTAEMAQAVIDELFKAFSCRSTVTWQELVRWATCERMYA